MEIFEGIDHFPEDGSPSAIAIGNFDGMHLGHQKILHALLEEGNRQKLKTYVLTFSNHPRKVLGQKRLSLIQTFKQRVDSIKKYDINGILIIPFDSALADLTAKDFIKQILVNALRIRSVIVGHNFHFGKNREGSVEYLEKTSRSSGFKVISVPAVIKDGIEISSTHIRQLLLKGDIEKANRLLGHPYTIEGIVKTGTSTGKTLGFPTANIHTDNEILPSGVFITRTHIRTEEHPSLTNVGTRPTFQSGKKQIESHIIQFQEDLYGEKAEVAFIKKIRKEKKFESSQALADQIRKDLHTAKDHFNLPG